MIKLYTIYTCKEKFFVHFTDLIFLFCFVPITLLLSFLEKSTEYKNFILIISSVLFFTWGRPFAVSLLLLTCVFDWGMGLLCSDKKSKPIKIFALSLDAIVNSCIFLLFERSFLFGDSTLASLSEKLMPLGIAIMTVRGFSYVFDVFTGRTEAEKNPFCVMTYSVCYPLMTGTPLVRYGDMRGQILKRTVTGKKLSDGLTRIILGMTKLAVVTPVLQRLISAGLNPNEVTMSGSFVGMGAHILNICVTWSGLCDLSIGLGKIFGFDFKESFTGFKYTGYVTGFTRSFHSSLCDFGRDVFITPLQKKNQILRIIGTLICGAVIGLWYKSTLMFLIAGVTAALFVAVEEIFLKKILDSIMPMITWAYTTVVLGFVFSLTAFDGFSGMLVWAKGLIGKGEGYFMSVALKDAITQNAFLLAVLAVCYLPFSRGFFREKIDKHCEKSVKFYSATRIAQTVCLCVMLLLSAVTLTEAAIR